MTDRAEGVENIRLEFDWRSVDEEGSRFIVLVSNWDTESQREAKAAAATLNERETKVAGLEAENNALRKVVRDSEPDRERLEFFERELSEIGKALGCAHNDDGYSRCL